LLKRIHWRLLRCTIDQQFSLEREIPSLCMRKYKVERFIPNRAAAPFEPAIIPLVRLNALRM